MVKDDLLDRFFRTIPLGGLLVLIFAAAALKNWRDVLAAMIPVLTAFAVLALFFAVTQVKVTPASAFALVLLSGLAVDYGIYAAFLGRNPQAKQIRSAVFLSAATTVLGAGALLFSSHPALSGTGVVLAVGISAAAASGIWVEPLLFVRKQRNGKIYSALLAVSAVLLLSGCASVPQNELPDRQFSGRAVCTAGENKLSFMLMAKREAGKLSAAAVSSSGMLIFNLDKDGNISWGAGIPENFRSKAHILVQDISKIFLSYPLPELADRSGKEYILTENISGGSTLCGGSIFSSKWQVQYSGNGKKIIFERWGIFSPAYRLDIVLR